MDIKNQKISFHIEPFQGEKNYELWSIRIESLFAKEGLFKHIKIKDYGYEPVIKGQELINPSPDVNKTTAIIKLNLADGPLLQIRYQYKAYKV